ncbi:unnamed protein product [Acanthoscelides obtectus]|uniref:Uncharacterized protein n=1 Tax=Acanthoscelides obtectus TaxID=200917 RepID=A0A9P0PIT7_ACAOB|nr:unnamed protein product [Acanthoscelides obtectus]CAK1673091.1 hypothetical protein AOBTE_LOCUS29236 [Acanthoscelides obtectus]
MVKCGFIHSTILIEPANSIAFNQFRNEYYISVPQTKSNLVQVFKFSNNILHPYKRIPSNNVKSVTSFEIVFRSFIAVDGQSAGILEFLERDVIRWNVSNSNLNGIHYWLPVPVDTLRDEVILFAEREVDHGSHKSFDIEIITYNGVKFEEHEDVQCHHFGEKTNRLVCLSGIEGMVGSSYIVLGDIMGLIVPRPQEKKVLLFFVNTAIRKIDNPKIKDLEYYKKLRKELEKIINESEFHLAEVKKYKSVQENRSKLRYANVRESIEPKNISNYSKILQELSREVEAVASKVKELIDRENRTHYESITINGSAVFQGPATFSEAELEIVNDEPANNLLQDIVRKDNISEPLSNKTFTNLEASEVNFQKVNDVEATEIIYLNDTAPTINGNLIFEEPVETENIVSALRGNSSEGGEEGSRIISNRTLHFPANITVDFINGVNFTEFTRGLCLVNAECYIPGTVIINGNISSTNAEIFQLNGLKFPDEYMFDGDGTQAKITGHKTFVNTLTANEVSVVEKIDGVNPKEIITLSTNQHIPTKLTFQSLHVTEKLNVTGRILDEHGHTFAQKPTLQHSNILQANVNFKDLEVDGKIIVGEHFNGKSFKGILEDIVYQDKPKATISALKKFPQPIRVLNRLNITTYSINDVNLPSLVTKDKQQALKMNRLNGEVTIRNLHLLGDYNGINVTKLEKELVMLTGDQYVGSTLIFMDELEVNDFKIEKLNDVLPEEYFYTTDNNTIHANMEFDDVLVKNLVVNKNVEGISSSDGLFDGLDGKYLSITKNQSIDSNYFIGLSNVEDMVVDAVNDISSNFSSQSKLLEVIKQALNQSTLRVKDLHFEESVTVNIVNNRTINNFTNNLLQLLKNEASNLTVEGNVFLDDIDIDRFGNTNWSSLVANLIFKNNTNFSVKDTKTFTKELSIEKLIQTEKLNNVFLDNILTKQGEQVLKGDILMKGNVSFMDLELQDDQGVFSKLLVENGTFVITGDMVFSRMPHIKNLTFDGSINGKDLEKEIRNMYSIDNATDINLMVIFERPVNISGNVHVTNSLNNISLSDALSKIVIIGEDTSISGVAVFTHPVLINESLIIERNLITHQLSGFILDDWRDRAILLNRGYLPGNYVFEEVIVKDNLITKKVNNMSMEKIIPLVSNQSIAELHFENVLLINDITAVNTVNGRNLSEEFANSFMLDGDQYVPSMIFANNVLIRKNLNTSLLNNKPAKKVVTINTDQELTANYDFKAKITIQGDLNVHGLLNGIDTKKWRDNLLKVSGVTKQKINRSLDVTENVTFEENVDGDGLIAGLDLVELVEKVDEIKLKKLEVDRGVIDDYNNICTDIKYLSGMTASQIYKFKYFEMWEEMVFGYFIRHTFYFEFNNSRYLLVNEDNCKSHIFVFGNDVFVPVTTTETGDISQTIAVRDGDKALYLITNNQKPNKPGKCSNSGTNAWVFEDRKLELMFKMEDMLLLQDSLIPNTFYGLDQNGVSELVIRPSLRSYLPVRKWIFSSENAKFLPRGMQTGLTLYNEKKLIQLNRINTPQEMSDDNDLQTVLRGTLHEIPNKLTTKQMNGTVIVTTVGTRASKETLLVTTEKDDRGTDFINVFSNPIEGDLFQRIPVNKPSSILSLDFGQGQTLLVVLEDEGVLKVYEYKGIEGFKLSNSAEVSGSQLFSMSLPLSPQRKTTKVIGVVDGNKIKIIRSVMVGARYIDEEKCHLNL